MNTTPLAFLVAGLCACAHSPVRDGAGRSVVVEIQADDGRVLPLYPTAGRGIDTRVYAEALRGQRYRIVVHNRQDRRIGLVIAVDGRNVISGQKSWLRGSERMYVLGPYESQSYEGWRTAADRVNRFYFTESGDSYAAAFGDESAMGLISVAAYAEVRRTPPPRRMSFGFGAGAPGAEPPAAEPSRSATGKAGAVPAPAPSLNDVRSDRVERSAGTGYGPEAYSPSYTVTFEPEASPLERTFIKYEWRESLVRMGVLKETPVPPPNRLWDQGYAPPPPRRW